MYNLFAVRYVSVVVLWWFRVDAVPGSVHRRLFPFFSLKLIIIFIIESVDSISKDERGFPLTQYITNGRISRGGYTFTHFKHHHRVLRLISYRMGV